MSATIQRQTEIVEAARQLPADRRAAYLDGACDGDPALRQGVESLLKGAEPSVEPSPEPHDPLLDQPTKVLTHGANAPLTSISETPGESPGQMVGRYKLLEKIGEGGFGTVYVAEQCEPVKRQVALKIIKLGMDTVQVVARFQLEQQALAIMEHPHIARVLDAGAMENGRPYFVMEMVRGTKITDYCDENHLSTRERLGLFLKTCHAIQHAHQKGIIHRDIKPSNILVTSHDGAHAPKVIDFGIAKAIQGTDSAVHTQFQQLIGTPAYMSPEQVESGGTDIDTRSDVYSLGVVLYELLTGHTPLEQKELLNTGADKLRRLIHEKDPPRPSTRLTSMAGHELTDLAASRKAAPAKLVLLLRGDLDWIAMKCLEKDRARRYETVSALAMDIQRHLNNEPVFARPQSQLYRLQKLVSRNKIAAAAAAAVTISLIAGIIASTWQARRALRAQHEADTARREAEASALQTKRTLAASDFLQGVRLISEENNRDALAYIARSLSEDPGNIAAATRLTTLLTYHAWRLPVLVLQQMGAVTSARFNSNGAQIITTSVDGTVRQWDAKTGKQTGRSGPIAGHMLASSSDGERVITDSAQNTARVWDAQNGQLLAQTAPQNGPVYSARFSPDGRRIITVSSDSTSRGTARVWDAGTGQPLTPALNLGVTSEPIVEAPAAGMDSVEFSPDGNRFVTAWLSSARVWDAGTGQPLTDPLPHPGQVSSARFSADGRRVVTASLDGTARIWDARTGRPLGDAMNFAAGLESVKKSGAAVHPGETVSAQFTPDGTAILTTSWEGVSRLWNPQTGQPLTPPLRQGGQISSARFSPNGRVLLTASDDGSARLWDVRTGQPLAESLKHDGPVYSAEFSPDGTRVVTASADTTARVWNVPGPALLPESIQLPADALSAQLSPDLSRVLVADASKSVRVWDARTGLPVTKPLSHDSPVVLSAFNADATRIATVTRDAVGSEIARIWDAQTGQPLSPSLQQDASVNSIQFSPDGNWLVVALSDRTARLWNLRDANAQKLTLHHESPVLSAQFSPNSSRIVTTSADATARVWDLKGQPIGKPIQHGPRINSAQFSSDGTRLVTASDDSTARLWDVRTGGQIGRSLDHKARVRSAQFSPDGGQIVTASEDETSRVWDSKTGKPLTEPLKHQGIVYSAQFSPGGQQILTISTAGDHSPAIAARLWDVQTGQPLTGALTEKPRRHLENFDQSGRFSADGRRFAVGSHIWDIPPQTDSPAWLPQLANAVAGEVLNPQGFLQPVQTPLFPFDQLRLASTNKPWSVWGHWFLLPSSPRAISPYSTITVPHYIESCIQAGTPDALNQADWLALGDPSVSERISEARSLVEIENEAAALSSEGALSQGEAKYRQFLASSRKVFPNDPARWKSSIDGLADVLLREGKSAEVQQLFDGILTPSAANQPECLGLLRSRADFRARTGQWSEATADFANLIQSQPDNYLTQHALASLLLETGGAEAYFRHCAKALEQFAQTDDPAVAGCIAEDCLVLPPPADILSQASKLADTAIAAGQQHRSFAQFLLAKSLCAYRQGDFSAAAKWSQQTLSQAGPNPSLQAQACMVQAMSEYKLAQRSPARSTFNQGLVIIEKRMTNPGGATLGSDWTEWISARVLEKEAKGLIEPEIRN